MVVLSKMRRIVCLLPGPLPRAAGPALSPGAGSEEGTCVLEMETSSPCKGLLTAGRSWEPVLPLVLDLGTSFLEVV